MAFDETISEQEVKYEHPASSGVVWPRLLIGLYVLICAEVFSGASLQVGIWHPWTLLVTYWLYFAHFFFFTTLAVKTGRTSLWSLYLWGVLFGLYESWITKVIWAGYGGDGKLALGRIGPYGFSEIGMVVIFHPVMSFLIPLSVACVRWPSLRCTFPDLAWFTGRTRGARILRGYLVFSAAPVVAMNCGGPLNLTINVAVVIALLLLLSRLARNSYDTWDAQRIVVFGRPGFLALCVYLALLYGVTYRFLRFEALPSLPVQLLTFVWYAIVIGALFLHHRREPLSVKSIFVEPRERTVVLSVFAIVLGGGFLLSIMPRKEILFVPFVLNTVIWTLLGILLTGIALFRGARISREKDWLTDPFESVESGYSTGPDGDEVGIGSARSAAEEP
jgi:hypothetical protein